MIELQHNTEPAELGAYLRQHPGSSWDDPDFKTVRPIVRRQLNREQKGLCIYCEGQLHEESGHVEHIKSKGLNTALTFTYDNLAHSCDGPGHCGHLKKWQVLPVEPRPGCNRFFVLMTQDGKLIPSPGLPQNESQQAHDTLRILGLNAPTLARQRKSFADVLRYLSSKTEVDEFLSTAPFRWSLRGL
ncbi:MAG: TIGR02646 family protein [Deltaproteobacteria bacterium RIFOXYD12_FULL_50_9]|nr:MAG: TIGR02646 family protein [Deltaproteobacteria bacterium RIFOXYD12_FULL_50_9]